MFRDKRTYVPIGEGETYNVTIQDIAALETVSPVSKAS
jgi:predicted RNA-binding protein with TRAM domain